MTELLAIAFLGCAVISVLKILGYKGVGVSLALVLICMFGVLLNRVSSVGGEIMGLVDGAALSTTRDLAKIMGVAYVSSICESTCTALGEIEIAKIVEAGGRVEIIALLIPYFKSILDVGGALL